MYAHKYLDVCSMTQRLYSSVYFPSTAAWWSPRATDGGRGGERSPGTGEAEQLQRECQSGGRAHAGSTTGGSIWWDFSLFYLFGVGTSSFQSPRSPVLCFLYLYLFLLHVILYNIAPPHFRYSDLSVSTNYRLPSSMFSLLHLQSFSPRVLTRSVSLLNPLYSHRPSQHSHLCSF